MSVNYTILQRSRFPFSSLGMMPNVKYFWLQMTMIEDESFDDTFTNLDLPELLSFAIAGGNLTRVPMMFTAPKLKDIRFAYHPLEYITPFAFAKLPNLESLDLAGNGANPTLDVLKRDTLIFQSKFFTNLSIFIFSILCTKKALFLFFIL